MTNTAVIYIITKLELGGAQKVCLSLLNNVPDSHIATFLITGAQGPLVQEVQKNNHVIFLKNLTREIAITAVFSEIKTFFIIIKHLREIKKKYYTTIVHTHSTKAGLLGRWAAFFSGISIRVHTVHGFGFNNFQPRVIWGIIYFLELITSLITTHFICVSQADITTGTKLFPGFKNKNTLIRAAVDYTFFYPAHKTDFDKKHVIPATKTDKAAQFVFGTTACFKKQKNLFDLLNAFNLAYQKYPQARLEIIGDGELRSTIEQWITIHQLTHAIKLHGWQEHVKPIAQKWHVFVLTSLWEGLPCAVIEARLLKLPIISYKTGGVPEVIFDQINGLLYEQKDWQSLANGMIQLIEQPKFYTKLSSYQDNLAEFQETNMITQHSILYKKLARTQI